MHPGRFAALTPDKPAVVMSDTGETLTYAQLDDRSRRLARVLYDAGLRPGDDVVVLAENSPRCFEIYWAAVRSGLYVTAVDFHLQPAEAAYIVDDCDATALVTSAGQAATATEIVDGTPRVRLRLAFGGGFDGHGVAGHDDYEAALAAASAEPVPGNPPRGKDMLYSSGTTGRPKGVKPPLSDKGIDDGPDPLLGVFGPVYGFDADTVYLSPAPLYHAAPLRFGAMVHAVGGTVVVMPRFDAETALAAIGRFRATHSQWVPTMFVRMLKLPDEVRARHDVSSLTVAVHAAAPCPVEVKHRMIDWWGPVLHEYYGSTEALGVTMIDSHEWLAHPGSVGRSRLGVVRVCDDAGDEVPVGDTGLVYFEREVLPFSYHKDTGKTAEAQNPKHPNWGTNGDIGHVDADGYLYLTDRRAFTIISGGVNVYPQEIEDALALHPAVLDVAVIGVPDDDLGERVTAVVRAAPGAVPGPELAEELRAFLRSRISHRKVPRVVDFVDELPRTETGKLRKHLLRARYTG
ncbi:putative acyl-CoA ligase [Pseudonocardia sulfidoxydans NBRC 16205]|uniref:Putative acyl-CoA ligase n=1 Tax=Pseudonocardia sulfidoxydans NBRC 16205 TaxID=1223511 RepID=A0A511DD58_9PSEU|nr:AMP-binding protein [Pseudonocardia sulfidoxydans]GEL21614.1 putative acyl-CoA ligase [Pseudonocardia sulfidoxydans NBRC 16205]